ncbi:MAG: hypothetical protein D6732_24195 [Methanobacteriota archaeon]|nr:MAG: hypothetical protein D6732_24195 [Euryarchaeota archaeon]
MMKELIIGLIMIFAAAFALFRIFRLKRLSKIREDSRKSVSKLSGITPPNDYFERVSDEEEDDFRNLEKVEEAVFRRFKDICPLHAIYIIPGGKKRFSAYVFFEKNKDVEECQHNGISQQITDCIYAELERFGRGNREEILVLFEFDSHENVVAHCGGNYFLRLR